MDFIVSRDLSRELRRHALAFMTTQQGRAGTASQGIDNRKVTVWRK